MNDDALQKNNKDFPSGTGSPYYMKMETFSALIKHIEEKSKVQDFMCQKLHLMCQKGSLPLLNNIF